MRGSKGASGERQSTGPLISASRLFLLPVSLPPFVLLNESVLSSHICPREAAANYNYDNNDLTDGCETLAFKAEAS